MGYSIDVKHAHRFIDVRFTGPVAPEELVSMSIELMEEPYLSMTYGIRIDFRQSEFEDHGPGVLFSLREFLVANQNQIQPFRLALLASDAHQVGLSRIFQNLAEGELPIKILVTNREDDAGRWAGRPYLDSPRNSPKPA